MSVFEHCCHVGWVAFELLQQSRSIPHFKITPLVAAVIAAIHDVGKWSPGFLCMCSQWLERENLTLVAEREAWKAQKDIRHEKHSQDSIQLLLQSRGIKQSESVAWAMVAGAHHGKMYRAENYGSGDLSPLIDEWHRQRQQIIEAIEVEFDSKISLAEIRKTDAITPWLMGLTSVADWIGSDESYFPVEKGLSPEKGKESARLAVESIGLSKPQINSNLSFEEIFGFGANDMQQKALSAITKPGIYVIEAPMGLGKTEAALACAYELLQSGQASGLYFALPTQLTSNRIHLRVKEFVEKITADSDKTRLAHANAWLEQDYYQPRPVQTSLTLPNGDATISRDWFASAKRALLANFGVGTIDQALMSIVAVKHFFVRRFALSGKVIIIDEVHSYDQFTGTLVNCLCDELQKLGCTIIILSATLLPNVRNKIIHAQEDEVQENSYPLITGKTNTGELIIPQRSMPAPKPTVKRIFKKQSQLIPETIEAARQGARVLWVCNTVNVAQKIFSQLIEADNKLEIGLLHSRFPHFIRQQQEEYWMERLGKNCKSNEGCILVSTQIVEQSVDIDADILVSELAPMDMLLQRIGRLWRHMDVRSQAARPVEQPEIWIIEESKSLSELREESCGELRKVLGVKAKVYHPYVLLKTYETLDRFELIKLADKYGDTDIRKLLESTYLNDTKDPESWLTLSGELEGGGFAERRMAEENTRLFSRLALDDQEGKQTRLIEIETMPLLIAKEIKPDKIVLLNNSIISLPIEKFDIHDARAIHENIVRVHAWPYEFVEKESALSFYMKGSHCLALLGEDNQLIIQGLKENMTIRWDETMGIAQACDKGDNDESSD
ncbi:MAG: CRISPR-associated helicase Cas3' [Ectothiorhodospiraceae bacterium]|nr:CRISPR-associated helicase Cas3' [Ectothiorhodospiraceae bacterium]